MCRIVKPEPGLPVTLSAKYIGVEGGARHLAVNDFCGWGPALDPIGVLRYWPDKEMPRRRGGAGCRAEDLGRDREQAELISAMAGLAMGLSCDFAINLRNALDAALKMLEQPQPDPVAASRMN